MSYKDQLQPFDIIVVYNPKSWLHRMIYKVTEYKAGHVALYIGGGQIVQAQGTGVKKSELRNYTPKHKIYICRTYMSIEYIMGPNLSYCIETIGKKYSFLQLPVLLIKYVFRIKRVPDVSREAMICSEFIANAFNSANIKISDKPAWEVTPADILNSSKVWRIECQ